jgi:hypothetical protein
MFGEKYLTHPETLTRWNTNSPFARRTVELRFADDCYRFSGLSQEQQDLIEKIYPFCGKIPDSATPELTDVLDVSVFCRAESEFREIEREGWQYDLDMMYGEEMVQIAGLGFAAKIVWRPRLQGYLWTPEQGSESFHGAFENFLRILIAYRLSERGGALLHSAALVTDTEASVLVGRSGHGKTTLSNLALHAGRRVLSDDLNALVIRGNFLWVIWVPFHGDVASPFQRPSSIPAQAFYTLEKSCRNEVSLEPKTQTLAHLISCSPYVNLDPYRCGRLLDSLNRMCDLVRCYRLKFRKDEGFLDLLAGNLIPEEGRARTGSGDISYSR